MSETSKKRKKLANKKLNAKYDAEIKEIIKQTQLLKEKQQKIRAEILNYVSEQNLQQLKYYLFNKPDSNGTNKKIYDSIIQIIPKINELKIKTFLIFAPLSENNTYESDYVYSYIEKNYKENPFEINYLCFVFHLNKSNELNYANNIKIVHSEFDIETKKTLINLFEQYLFGHYYWNGSNNYNMMIFYKSSNFKKIDTTKLRSDDKYPEIYVQIYLNIKTKDETMSKKIRKIINNIMSIVKKYDCLVDWHDDKNNGIIGVLINAIDESNTVEKLKKYIKNLKYVEKSVGHITKSRTSKEKLLWKF